MEGEGRVNLWTFGLTFKEHQPRIALLQQFTFHRADSKCKGSSEFLSMERIKTSRHKERRALRLTFAIRKLKEKEKKDYGQNVQFQQGQATTIAPTYPSEPGSSDYRARVSWNGCIKCPFWGPSAKPAE